MRRTTQHGGQLSQDHARTTSARGQCGSQAGHTATGNQHIAMDVLVHVAGGIFLQWRSTQATCLANEALVQHPGLSGPHEGLVVKACREQRREPAIDAEQVFAGAGPGVHALGIQRVVQLHLGHFGVGNGVGTTLQLCQGRRLLDARRDNAAGPMVFPGPGNDLLTRSQQGRRQCVTRKTVETSAVELEWNRTRAVQPCAHVGYAGAAHWAPPATWPLDAATSGFSPGL